MVSDLLKLATRGSALARAQAQQFADTLTRVTGLRVELRVVATTGDRVTDRPLHELGGKGLFTKEVEIALLEGHADLAVHSYKDVPVTMPLVPQAQVALTVAAVPPREDVADVLVTRDGSPLADLPPGATVGTTSLRRRALLLEVRPDLNVIDLRGNVDSRLTRVRAGEFDAILLAAAGLRRLGRLDPAVMHRLDPADFVPAAGQGALAVQCRTGDARVIDLLRRMDDPVTRACVSAEREVVRLLDGDCTSPIGAWCRPAGQGFRLDVVLPPRRVSVSGAATGGLAEQAVRRL